jgi:four helix bundle protein
LIIGYLLLVLLVICYWYYWLFVIGTLGGDMAFVSFEKLRVHELSESLADTVWDLATSWNHFARDKASKQIVRAADGIGANIAEGTGRGSFKDNARFVTMARGSLYETRHWLRRAFRRNLLPAKQVNRIKPLVDELGPKLNSYLTSIKKHKKNK